jgi:two-component system CheB/CheR fusion protein
VLQQKVISTFHYSLHEHGYLVLGKSETIGAAENLFSPVEKKLRIYRRKKDSSSRGETTYRLLEKSGDRTPPMPPQQKAMQRQLVRDQVPSLEKTIDDLLLSRFIPAAVVVNQEFEILQFRGSTGMFLEPAPGRASLNLLKMAKPGLAIELRNAIHKTQKSNLATRKNGIEIHYNGKPLVTNIEVLPLKANGDEEQFLIVFREIESAAENKNKKSPQRDNRIRQLEEELIVAKEELRSIIEEQETVNEELQSANEEIVSSNEELQSINEELETSKEEVESTNEELMTINQELQNRNDQLAESYEYAESLLATIRESLIVLDSELRIKSANRSFYEAFRTTEKETEGKLIFDLGNLQWDMPQLRIFLEDILASNQQFYGFEVTHVFPDIGERTMMLNARKVMQRVHRQELILLAIEDITEQTRAQKIIREREEHFRNIANSAPVMIWTSEATGDCNFFNNTWLEFTGKTIDEQIGVGWKSVINPVDMDELLLIYQHALDTHQPYEVDFRLARNDNTYRWVHSVGRPIFDLENNFTGFIGTVTEIHNQRMMNEELDKMVRERTQELEMANLNLARSNSELKEFAHIASHDLQEPLRKIQIFSNRILAKENAALSENGKDMLERMQVATKRMRSLIDDLLIYSRATLEEGEFERTSLNSILDDVKLSLQDELLEKNATVEANELGEAEILPSQFRHLFYNIINNAIKYSKPTRQLKISVQRTTESGNGNPHGPLRPGFEYCHLSFSDNGIGFDNKYEHKIFELFQKLHGKDEYSGTGVGLAIAKRIVENHHGFITAKSELDKGSTFEIYLPMKMHGS